jgi:hypothetical protein
MFFVKLTSHFFILVVYIKGNVIKVIQIRQALTIMRELVLVLQVKIDTSGCPLSFFGETLKHTILGRHRRIILAKTPVQKRRLPVSLGKLWN